jgi:hypothetical protein
MTKVFTDLLTAHGKAMLLTFEIFWILVFVLDQAGGQNSSGIPQFIYVNF